VKEIGGRIMKRRLDYCFVGSMLASRVRSVSVDNAEIASDHHPLFVDIDLDDPGSRIAPE
jgi:endonuclease/exonuclease/phosphatase family metal-dependent hydrolase